MLQHKSDTHHFGLQLIDQNTHMAQLTHKGAWKCNLPIGLQGQTPEIFSEDH